MKHLTLSLFFILVATISSFAQEGIEYGKPSDLKGLSKIYIQTFGDLKENERIAARINKAKIAELTIVENEEEAEIILAFGGDNFSAFSGVTHNRVGNSVFSTPSSVNLLTGEGRVFVGSADKKRARLVMRVQNEQETKLEKRPVTKFVNEFLKVYKQVNGIK